jgi:aminoglycoside phosphotransferase (APT) family kinase protein
MKPPGIAALTGNRALEARLASMLGADAARVLSADKLSGGAIQENWALDVQAGGATRRLVLRRDAPATIAASRGRREEFLLVRAAWEAGVRVPRPVGFCDDPEPIGAPFALMERVAGVAYGPKVVRDESLGGDRAALGRELGRQLARIHAVRPDAALAAILGPAPADPCLAEIARLRGWLDATGAARPGLEWALRRAELRAPSTAACVLTHRDFRTGNFLVDRDGLTAILDWEFAALSDPMADLGWFCAECWRFSRPDREGGGVCRREDFYAGYAAESGRAPDHDRVRWWELTAHLRWAVIALQQGLRHASGEERSLHLALTGRIADAVELMALRLTAALEDGR